ncbi:hypothetical protein ACFWP5_40625 [Streptomyces sp. NPDC058469]|uniref:hypothetical protein n=1 Tax=Streptomyces sp. NPDC058469 TaxID=3346514 RepID=UPI00366521B6
MVTNLPDQGGGQVVLVHPPGPLPEVLTGAAAYLQQGGRPDDVTVLTFGVIGRDEELWRRLSAVLGDCKSRGVTEIRLGMPGGAARDRGGQVPARTLSDRLDMPVIAAPGEIAAVPGGSLFARNDATDEGGWWRFSPGLPARPLGIRHPVPWWGPELTRIGIDSADGHTVEAIPAGLLVRPTSAPAEQIDAITYAVPVDDHRLTVLVGVRDAPPVTAEAVVTVLAALPARLRVAARLAPGDGGDLLPLAEEVADLLGAPVEVASGLPLRLMTAEESYVRLVLTGTDGEPSWMPWVESVTCHPRQETGRPPAEVARWRAPVGGLLPTPEPGVLTLDEHWRLVLTRAGMWIGSREGDRQGVTDRGIDPDVVSVDLGAPGVPLDSGLLNSMDRILGELDESARRRVVLDVFGSCPEEQFRELRRLAVRHGVALAPRSRSAIAPSEALTELRAPSVMVTNSQDSEDTLAPSSAVRRPPFAPSPSYTSASRTAEPATVAQPVVGVASATSAPFTSAALTGEPLAGAQLLEGQRPEAAAALVGTPLSIAVPGRPPVDVGGSTEMSPAETVSIPAALNRVTSSVSAGELLLGPAVPGGAPARVSGAATATARVQEPVRAPQTIASTPEAAAVGRALAGAPGPVAAPAPTVPQPLEPRSAGTDTEFGHGGDTRSDSGRPENADEATSGESTTAELSNGDAQLDQSETVQPMPETAVPTLGPPSVASFTPVARSSGDADRALLQSALAENWERHSAEVMRALTRIPALRGRELQDDVRSDLIAVVSYLSDAQGPLSAEAIRGQSVAEPERAKSLLASLSSGLRRLPSHRGAVVRGLGTVLVDSELRPGDELFDTLPVSALDSPWELAGDRYVVWSVTGRRARVLFDGATADPYQEIVFAPRTRLRVLDVVDADTGRTVLLRELADAAEFAPRGVLDEQDELFRDKLHATLAAAGTARHGGDWPVRSVGPLTRRSR